MPSGISPTNVSPETVNEGYHYCRRASSRPIFAWAALAVMLSPPVAVSQQYPPNILVIMGDDIYYWNISAYNRGQMLRPVRAGGTRGR